MAEPLVAPVLMLLFMSISLAILFFALWRITVRSRRLIISSRANQDDTMERLRLELESAEKRAADAELAQKKAEDECKWISKEMQKCREYIANAELVSKDTQIAMLTRRVANLNDEYNNKYNGPKGTTLADVKKMTGEK